MLNRRSPEEKAEFTRLLDERLREWLDEEGLSSKKDTQDEDSVFHYVVEYPQKGGLNIHLIRPKRRGVLALVAAIQMSPQHAQPYKNLGPEDRRRLSHKLRRTAFRGGEVGFSAQVEDGIPVRWQLDHIVYDDGVSQDAVFRGMKKLFSKHLSLVEVLNEELGSADGTPGTTGDEIKGYL